MCSWKGLTQGKTHMKKALRSFTALLIFYRYIDMFQKHLEADGAVMRKNIQESTKTEEAMSDFTLMP
jgi:hypothetical protein